MLASLSNPSKIGRGRPLPPPMADLGGARAIYVRWGTGAGGFIPRETTGSSMARIWKPKGRLLKKIYFFSHIKLL